MHLNSSLIPLKKSHTQAHHPSPPPTPPPSPHIHLHNSHYNNGLLIHT